MPTFRIMTPNDKIQAALSESHDDRAAEEATELATIDEQIEAHAVEIDGLKRTSVETILAIGERLHTARKLLAGSGRDGQFRPWVKERCGFSHQTTYNYIHAFSTFGTKKCKTVLHLFGAKAIYTLSADACPEKAAKEAMRRAAKGERINHKLAKELKAKYTPTIEGPPDDDEPGEMGPSIGLAQANEAIDCLSGIPKNDEFRARAFQIVKDWLTRNE